MNEGAAKSSKGSSSVPSFVRPGFNNIAPYIVVNGAAKFIEFLKAAFQANRQLHRPRINEAAACYILRVYAKQNIGA